MCVQERDGHPGSEDAASISGREQRDGPQMEADPDKAGHAGLEDLGSKQRKILAIAVDTAILKVTLKENILSGRIA